MAHPVRSRVADVIAYGTGIDRRGSGYLVTDGWVLTARHVVAGAESIGVWLGAPLRLDKARVIMVAPPRALLDEGPDLALLPIGPTGTDPVDPALFGRLDRESSGVVPVAAAGFPRAKLRPASRLDNTLVRDLAEVRGSIAPRANTRTGTYELADLSYVPDEDPEPDKHSPWEGMSGAAVWADDRLIAVVGQHHPREGLGALTLRPVETLLTGAPDRAAAWRDVLPSQLPRRAADLWLLRRSSPGEVDLDLARRVAEALAPLRLEDRVEELVLLDELLRSDQQWGWVRGEAFAGKTAMMAWLVTHPPPDMAVVSCFIRETDPSTTTAEYALTRLTGQLAAVADRFDHRPASFVPDLRVQLAELLPLAARACRERDQALALVVDGLDEYDALGVPLREWIPGVDELPAGATLLASSRSGIEPDLPPDHPLRAHLVNLDPAPAAQLLREEATGILTRALAERGQLDYGVLGFLSVADGPLASDELRALLHEVSIVAFGAQVTGLLTGRLRRVVSPAPEPSGRTAFAFAHPALRDAALALLADDRAAFVTTLRRWCERFRDDGWPDDTPRYVLAHFPRGLYASGRYDELVALVADDGWRRRLEAFDPSHAMYLTAVRTAWRAAEEHSSHRVASGGLADGLAVEIRACLDVASVASLSSRLTPELLVALVGADYWSPQAAFDMARQAPSPWNRSLLLVGLARLLAADDVVHDRVVRAAITATAAIDDEMRCAWQWSELAPLVPPSLLDESLRLVQALPRRLRDDRRPRVVAESALLARAAALGQGGRALEIVAALSDEDDRARALTGVAGALPEELHEAALDLVRGLEWYGLSAEPLAALAVAELGRDADDDGLAREALDAALALESPRERSWVLRLLAPALPEPWVTEVLTSARATLTSGDRWTLQSALAARLGALGRWAAGLEVARELRENAIWLVRGLVAVAPHVPDGPRGDLADELLDAALTVDPISLPFELATVAPYLTEPLLRHTLDRFTGSDEDAVKARQVLLPRLAELGNPSEAYDLAAATESSGWIGERHPGVGTWAALVPHLPEPLRAAACERALGLISRVDDADERTLVELAVARALGDELTGALLERAAGTNDHPPAALLRGIAPHLADDLVPRAIEMALAMPMLTRFGGQSIGSPLADTLVAFGPRLDGPLRERALAAAREGLAAIDDADARDTLAVRIAAAFGAPEVATEGARQAVERRVREAGPGPWRDRLVDEIGEILPADLVERVRTEGRDADARTAAHVGAWLRPDPAGRPPEPVTLRVIARQVAEIRDGDLRASCAVRLAPHTATLLAWSDPEDGDAMGQAQSRADLLALLGPHLTEDQLRGALRVALELLASQWAMPSRDVLAPLAEAMASVPRERLHPLWTEALHAIAPLHRRDTLRHLASLLPIVLALGGEAAARSLLRSVEETGSWWS